MNTVCNASSTFDQDKDLLVADKEREGITVRIWGQAISLRLRSFVRTIRSCIKFHLLILILAKSPFEEEKQHRTTLHKQLCVAEKVGRDKMDALAMSSRRNSVLRKGSSLQSILPDRAKSNILHSTCK